MLRLAGKSQIPNPKHNRRASSKRLVHYRGRGISRLIGVRSFPELADLAFLLVDVAAASAARAHPHDARLVAPAVASAHRLTEACPAALPWSLHVDDKIPAKHGSLRVLSRLLPAVCHLVTTEYMRVRGPASRKSSLAARNHSRLAARTASRGRRGGISRSERRGRETRRV